MIDLRSDTVTTPTDAMRKVIAEAEVGDDVYHDDPGVLALEEHVAGLLGKDAAMYVPTGTMSNQVALRVHTDPGDVVIAAQGAHINGHELGAPAVLSGIRINELPAPRGTFTPDQLRSAIPVPPPSMPSSLFEPSTLVAAENTHNEAGGTVWPLELLTEVAATAHELGLAAHLDGARLWNASVATGVAERDLAAGFDTVSVCFSKGLGAPMGSALVGRADLIDRARRFKQMFGGGFRQAGLMAAGACYAVEHHRDRLAEDHAAAARLAGGLAEIKGAGIDPDDVDTNIVFFEADDAYRVCDELEARGVLMLPLAANRIRAVTHLGIGMADIDATLKAVSEVL
ncbi:MAG: aminotransferase class I/II-fold pyridoxal phosphate-dependent enzyme [Acidimicrobiia bacterium]|nr:aminotransferase class I/II-fold pyridoxal phosphate-dependent enzyme [Acidimicrobiia bacterium]NNL97839.1 aminotransferase class I/II-fold pyridoxal phosphate-dependent enzyme [Acidimicrobiia bacterium]